MIKRFLMAPGPTEIPPENLLAMAQPIMHHRSAEFSAILARSNEGLQYLFQTAGPVVTLAGSGTAGMEAAVTNLLSPGDEAIVVRGGKFGERWGELCVAFGMQPHFIDIPWGTAVTADQIAAALKAHPQAKAVFVTLCETSTGTLTDLAPIGKVVADSPAVLAVDAVSALGADECRTDEWKIDVVVTGSQKALMLPPGLAFVSISDKAWKLIEQSTSHRYYLDLRAAKKAWAKADTPYTPAVSLILSLEETIKAVKAEGIEKVWARHAYLAKAMRAGFQGMGLGLYSKRPSNGVTAVLMPEGLDSGTLVKKLRLEYGVTIAGGQDQAKGKIFRVASMGYTDIANVPIILTMVSMVLKEMGHNAPVGPGIDAALPILTEFKLSR